MSITKILGNNDLTDTEKLEQVAAIVTGARESYGNAEVEIPVTKINTPHGYLPFEHLEDDSKVALLLNEAISIKASAIAAEENQPGTVLNKKVEELLATNPLFTNASAGSEFSYL